MNYFPTHCFLPLHPLTFPKSLASCLIFPIQIPNLIFLYSSGKSRLEGDFLQPQEGIPKDKTEVLKLLSSCALSQLCSDHPEILEEDWDA